MDEPIEIVASRPVALIDEVESIIDQPIHWVDSNQKISWSDLGLSVPQIFFQSGWLSKAFRNLGREVLKSGGKVVCFSDNSWKNTPRQWLGSIVFKMIHRQNFDAVWVPGNSAQKLMQFYGMPKNCIYQGMYSADSEVFFTNSSLMEREKTFIFIGQLIERKGISLLVAAFNKFRQQYPDWKLKIVGQGELLNSVLDIPGIEVEGFKSPSEVSTILQNCRFLILPSHEEHWGLVVHEASLCGCGLILSDAIGSAQDLVGDHNGIIFKTNSESELHASLVKAASYSEQDLRQVALESKLRAASFTPKRWSKTLMKIIHNLDSKNINLAQRFLKC